MKNGYVLSFSSKEEEERTQYQIDRLSKIRPNSYSLYGIDKFVPRVLLRGILIDSYSQDKDKS